MDNVKILSIIATLDGLTFSMFMSIWTPYITSVGASSFYLGVLGSITGLIMLIWGPIVGSLSDVFGRKRVLVQLLAVAAFGNLLMILSSSLIVITISRILCGLAAQILTTVKSLIDDNTSVAEDKMKALNRLGALQGMTFIVGALGSALLNRFFDGNGTTIIFTIVTIMLVINIGLALLIKTTKTPLKKEENPQSSQKSGGLTEQVASALKNLTDVDWPKYWDLFLIKLLIDIAFNMFIFNNGFILTKKFGITGSGFGFFMAFLGLNGIAGSLAMGKLKEMLYSDDGSGFKRLLHGTVILAGCFSLASLSTSTSVFVYVLCLWPMPFARGIIESTMTEVLFARTTQEDKGKVMGAFESTLAFGGLVVPLVSGIISSIWDESFTLMLAAVPILVSASLCYYNNRKVHVHSKLN